jgi:hypothetical protein
MRARTTGRWGRRVAGLTLAVLAAVPTLGQAAASATPVPFPAQAPAARGAAGAAGAAEAGRGALADFDGFLAAADRYGHEVYAATERYRAYVTQVQRVIASCTLDSAEAEGLADHPFAELIGREAPTCERLVAEYRAQAQAQAAKLDAATAFLGRVKEARVSVQRQKDQRLLAQHADRLKAQVDDGWQAVRDAEQVTRRAGLQLVGRPAPR